MSPSYYLANPVTFYTCTLFLVILRKKAGSQLQMCKHVHTHTDVHV